MKIQFQGKAVEATSLEFRTLKEDFNDYQLVDDDGKPSKVVRMKTVVTRILRIEGEVGPEGNPMYFINSQNVIAPID